MALWGNKRPDGSPGTETGGASPTPIAPTATPPAARDQDVGVPPFRPAPKDSAAMNTAPKPTAAPAPSPVAPPRPAAVGVPARPMGKAEASERRTLVVGRGISLQGTVADAERLVVEGRVESQMIQAAELHVAQSGVFKGEVQVEDAEIAGEFDGTITARGNLIIRASGKVSGTVRCRKLTVDEGGQVSGQMQMLTDAMAATLARTPLPHQAEA